MFYFSEDDDLASGAGSFYPLAPALLSIVLAKITLSPPAVFDTAWHENHLKLRSFMLELPSRELSPDDVCCLLGICRYEGILVLVRHYCRRLLGIPCKNQDGEAGLRSDGSHGDASVDPGESSGAADAGTADHCVGAGTVYGSSGAAGPDPLKGTTADPELLDLVCQTSFQTTRGGISLVLPDGCDRADAESASAFLLGLLDLGGAVVTVDAPRTIRGLAQAICSAGADYFMLLRDNLGVLLSGVEEAFAADPASLARRLTKTGERVYGSPLGSFAGVVSTGGDRGSISVMSLPSAVLSSRKIPRGWNADLASQFSVEAGSGASPDGKAWRRLYVSSLSPDHGDLARYGHRVVNWDRAGVGDGRWFLDVDFGRDQILSRNQNYRRNMDMLGDLALRVARDFQPRFRRPSSSEIPSPAAVAESFYMSLDRYVPGIARLLVEDRV